MTPPSSQSDSVSAAHPLGSDYGGAAVFTSARSFRVRIFEDCVVVERWCLPNGEPGSLETDRAAFHPDDLRAILEAVERPYMARGLIK